MTEPRRLIETCEEPFELALLKAGLSVKASTFARESSLSLIHSNPAGTLGVLSFFPPRKRRLLLVALSLSTLAAAVPLGYYVWQTQRRAPHSVVAESVDSSPVDARTPVSSDVTKPETSNFDESVIATPDGDSAVPGTPTAEAVKRSRNAAADTISVAGSTKSTEPNLLKVELSALDAARGKLHAGDAGGALSLLDAYQRDFPHPRLALEAEVLRIFAYDMAGQKQLAKKRAEAFVVKYPRGVLSARVRRYLEP